MIAPRFEERGAFLIAGLHVVYTWGTMGEIPAQWQQFAAMMDNIPGRVGNCEYGVTVDIRREGMDYLTGIEIATSRDLSSRLVCVSMPAQRYAVFTHDGPIAGIRQTTREIWDVWLPSSGFAATAAPNFEQYDERFNARTGSGIVEIWIGVEPKG